MLLSRPRLIQTDPDSGPLVGDVSGRLTRPGRPRRAVRVNCEQRSSVMRIGTVSWCSLGREVGKCAGA